MRVLSPGCPEPNRIRRQIAIGRGFGWGPGPLYTAPVPTFAAELEAAREACAAAGALIRTWYVGGDAEVTHKGDDSPLTSADLAANDAILSVLQRRFPGDAVLSEESADDLSRLDRERVWIVDPLDGTRDFVARTGDFAVHVALAVGGEPAVAALYKPIGDAMYWATAGAGARARAGGVERALAVSTVTELDAARLGVTRLFSTDNLARFLRDHGLDGNVRRIGASIKMMAVAAGDAEASLCLHGREKQWDTCAPGLIVQEAGGRVTDLDGRRFVYNTARVAHDRGILMTNGHLHDQLLERAQGYFEA